VGYRFCTADVGYLRSAAGVSALAAAAELPLTAMSRLSDVAAVRQIAGSHGPAVLETALLRRKAATKLQDAADWLFTDDALQQATPTAVARHRAQRLRGRDVHDVTCSIGAELLPCCRWPGGCWAPISIRCAWRWRRTTSPGWHWSGRTRWLR